MEWKIELKSFLELDNFQIRLESTQVERLLFYESRKPPASIGEVNFLLS